MVSGPSPLLVSVTVCAALEVPTSWPAKLRLAVDRLTAGAVPVPVSVTIWGLVGSLSVMVSVPFRTPVCAGLKTTLILQLPWGLRDRGHSLKALKSPVAARLGFVYHGWSRCSLGACAAPNTRRVCPRRGQRCFLIEPAEENADSPRTDPDPEIQGLALVFAALPKGHSTDGDGLIAPAQGDYHGDVVVLLMRAELPNLFCKGGKQGRLQ